MKGIESIEGYPVHGVSIAGYKTCVIFPSFNLVFDIGVCLQRAISQDFLFISHSHLDHIGGLPMYVRSRGLRDMKPPTIIVPTPIKMLVEEFLDVSRKLDQSDLKYNLIGLDVGEEFRLRNDIIVKAFRTFHEVPSQGYLVYSEKQKLKPEYSNPSSKGEDVSAQKKEFAKKIKELKSKGVKITDTVRDPEIAFTGDTTSDFIVDETNGDVLRAKILVMESTYVGNAMTVEDARSHGHIHLSEIISHAKKFKNRAILLTHFSARYKEKEIQDETQDAVSASPLAGRVFALRDDLFSKVE